MNPHIAELLARLGALESELEAELQKSRLVRGFQIAGKSVKFDADTLTEHRAWKTGLIPFLRGSTRTTLLTAPLIYSVIVPIVILDAWFTAYQQLYFRAFRIALVRRSDYIVFDRHHLAYLNRLEAFNCLYCGYANGVIAYVREIASRTEQYWCPIKHALRIRDPHGRYAQFLEYGDAQGYRSRLAEYRTELEQAPPASTP